MSTSSKLALERPAEPEARPFPYPELGGPVAGADGRWAETLPGRPSPEEQARGLGRQEGAAQARAACEQQVASEREAVCAALAEFRQERAAYYQRVEAEVVQLALSIARKILHREAQLDPFLLAGLARVALEKIKGAAVVVRVHPHHAAEWREYFTRRMEPGDRPEVVEDSSLEPGRCRLETAVGTTELGLETQLKEIEQGLFDLLAQRPPASP